MLFEGLAVPCVGLFGGYLHHVRRHPARLECGTELAATEFGPNVVLGLVMPFTLVVILPTNKRLLDPGLDRGTADAAALLDRWGQLHAVRTGFGALAFGVLVWHLVGDR